MSINLTTWSTMQFHMVVDHVVFYVIHSQVQYKRIFHGVFLPIVNQIHENINICYTTPKCINTALTQNRHKSIMLAKVCLLWTNPFTLWHICWILLKIVLLSYQPFWNFVQIITSISCRDSKFQWLINYPKRPFTTACQCNKCSLVWLQFKSLFNCCCNLMAYEPLNIFLCYITLYLNFPDKYSKLSMHRLAFSLHNWRLKLQMLHWV